MALGVLGSGFRIQSRKGFKSLRLRVDELLWMEEILHHSEPLNYSNA